jgi:hypothetical protein
LEETGNIKPQNLIQTVPSITPDYASVKRCSPSFSIVVVTRSPGLSQTCFSVRKVLRACSIIDLLFMAQVQTEWVTLSRFSDFR